MQRAVKITLEKMEIPDEYLDNLSIERQANQLVAMLSHLRRICCKRFHTKFVRSEDALWADLSKCRTGTVTLDIMQIAKLMKNYQKNKKTTQATETKCGDVHRGQIKANSEFSTTKARPPRGERKSKKAAKVTKSQGEDAHG